MADVKKQNLLERTLGLFGGGNRSSNVDPTRTVGSMGTSIFGGFITEEEKNARLTGREKYRTYSDILANTSIVAAGTRYFLNLLTSAAWKAEPAETENDNELSIAELRAEQIEAMMNGMLTPWHRVVRRAAMYRFYGFSIQEWTAKRMDDGTLGLLDIAPRPQITIDRWDVDVTGHVQGMVQRSPQTQEEIYLPRSKVVYLVDDSLNDSPEGLGLFRNVVEPSARLKRYEQLEGFGFETDLRGIPVVRIPYAELNQAVKEGRADPDEVKAAVERLEGFVKKHIKNPQLGLTLDSVPYQATGEEQTPSTVRQFDVSLLEGDGANFEAVGTAIDRINHEIARVLGVEQLLLGQNRGTQALSEDKSHNFALIIDSTLQELQETFQKDFVERIFELNGWDAEFTPTLTTDKIQHRDIVEVGQVIKDMAAAGAVLSPDDPAINAIRGQLGLPNAVPVDVEAMNLMIPGQPGNSPDDPEDDPPNSGGQE